MVELAAEIEGLSVETDRAYLISIIPFAVETHECNGLGTRNIIFLDGHVMRHKDGEWEVEFAPYLLHQP